MYNFVQIIYSLAYNRHAGHRTANCTLQTNASPIRLEPILQVKLQAVQIFTASAGFLTPDHTPTYTGLRLPIPYHGIYSVIMTSKQREHKTLRRRRRPSNSGPLPAQGADYHQCCLLFRSRRGMNRVAENSNLQRRLRRPKAARHT